MTRAGKLVLRQISERPKDPELMVSHSRRSHSLNLLLRAPRLGQCTGHELLVSPAVHGMISIITFHNASNEHRKSRDGYTWLPKLWFFRHWQPRKQLLQGWPETAFATRHKVFLGYPVKPRVGYKLRPHLVADLHLNLKLVLCRH